MSRIEKEYNVYALMLLSNKVKYFFYQFMQQNKSITNLCGRYQFMQQKWDSYQLIKKMKNKYKKNQK